MKKLVFGTVVAVLVSCGTATTPQLGKASLDTIIDSLTLEEKVHLLIGTGMLSFSGSSPVVGETHTLVPGAAGTTYPIPRLGIPAIVLADGPAGLRIAPMREDSTDTYYCTAFPVATLLASTWNTELVENVGTAMGNEVLEYGVDVLLAPALNIHRNPLCGRNFEYYSEDPLLSGKITAAMVKGVQSNGVGTSIKHFAVNNQESNRMGNDAQVSQRALREIYLKGFEIAVKEAAPWTVMSSYNRINGTYASESKALLTNILRDDWGFEGVVMTDWGGGKNPPTQVVAGNDLLMPGTAKQHQAIVDAVKSGVLPIEAVNTNVRRILQLIEASPRFRGYAFSNKPDLAAHAAITRLSAAEGMILLKNDGALPLPGTVKNVAAFGITAYDFIAGGTGSGDVNEAYTVSLGEGLHNAGYRINAELQTTYLDYIASENEKNKSDPNNRFAMFMPKVRPGEFIPSSALLNKAVAEADVAFITIGRTSGEFMDRQQSDDFNLSGKEQQLIQMVCKAFHAAGKKVVVILNIGGVIETASWKGQPDAILLAWQAGQEGGNTVADVLSGKVNPSGKLPMTFPLTYADVPSASNFPLDYTPNAASIMSSTDTGKEPVRNIDYTVYEEGIFVGYRHFDTYRKEVSYPFGYGLSYTQFDYKTASVSGENGNYTIGCSIVNTGSVAGKEVVQLYVSAPGKSMNKPAKELKAFVKTKLLQPGESQTIQLKLTPDALASFDETNSQWVVEPGDYTGQIGSSSKDIKQSVNFNIPKEIVVEKCTK
jgi:beta-glucosidase